MIPIDTQNNSESQSKLRQNEKYYQETPLSELKCLKNFELIRDLFDRKYRPMDDDTNPV